MYGFTSANLSFEVVSSIEEESTDEMALNERFMQVCSARSSEHFFDGAVGSASGIVLVHRYGRAERSRYFKYLK